MVGGEEQKQPSLMESMKNHQVSEDEQEQLGQGMTAKQQKEWADRQEMKLETLE